MKTCESAARPGRPRGSCSRRGHAAAARCGAAAWLALVLAVPAGWAQRDFGVDVSHWQGATGIPENAWQQMYAEGKRFVLVKATEGLTGPDDPAMANNMTRATAAGLRAGVYHYAHPENRPTVQGAVQEAEHLLRYAGNFIGPGYLRPVLDLEGSAAQLSTPALTDWVIAFCDAIIARRGPGAAPIIYTTQFFANQKLDSRVAGYDLWLRTVSGGDPAAGHPPPEGSYTNALGVFSNWSFWQYSDTGSAGGISPIDLNVCHSEFKPLDSFRIPEPDAPVAPEIIAQPQSRIVPLGSGATFTVTVSLSSSTPLYYQWRLNGTNLAGATTTAYTRTNVQMADAGAYTVVITNAGGSVTSAVATLVVVSPIVLYEETFDGYASPSPVTAPGETNGFRVLFGAAAGPLDFTAMFGFDYSTITFPTNIPPAPRSRDGTTRGLYLTVNKDATGAAAAVNLYPISQSFTGNFALQFDLWINWAPPTASSTEHALFGINCSGSLTNRIGQPGSDGLFFAVDGDGGVSGVSTTLRDFAVFRGGGPTASPVLMLTGFGPAPLLGAQFDNANPGFANLFPAQTFGTFTTPVGSAGLRWITGEVRQENQLVTWLLNGVLVAQYTNTFGYTNGHILIGYNDHFSSIGDTANFVLFDNLRVERISDDWDGNGLPDAWELEFSGNWALPRARTRMATACRTNRNIGPGRIRPTPRPFSASSAS